MGRGRRGGLGERTHLHHPGDPHRVGRILEASLLQETTHNVDGFSDLSAEGGVETEVILYELVQV